jgi:hypothetical protein
MAEHDASSTEDRDGRRRIQAILSFSSFTLLTLAVCLPCVFCA